MVEFQYRPFRKIIINEIFVCPLEDLIHLILLATPPYASSAPLRWCEGWVFSIIPYNLIEKSWDEQVKKGIVYWNSVTLAPFPTYRTHIDVNQGQVKIPLLDLSYSDNMVAFIDWFEEAFKEKIAVLPRKSIKTPGIA